MLNIIKKFLQIILYIILQVLFIPFAIVGLIDGLCREMVLSRRDNISFSAGQALQYRWIMHYFDTREDALSVKFVKEFPYESHFGLWGIMGALIIAQRCFGLRTKMCKLPKHGEETIDTTSGARVLAFDKIMEKYIDEVEQIVLPGAGFDLITLKYTKNRDVDVYEIDQVNTLNAKIKTLKKADIDYSWINFVPVDYSKESWADKLVESGFDRAKKTLFIWQSVSLYLNENQVRDSLHEMVKLSSDGSIIAQDFYSKAFISGEMSNVVKQNADLIGRMGEPWIFGLDMSDKPMESVKSFLASCGLEMIDYNQFGIKTSIEPFYCIVEARKQ